MEYIKKIFNAIISFIKMLFTDFIFPWLKSLTKKDVIYILVILFILYLLMSTVRTCSNLEKRYYNNIEALTDTIQYYETKNGNLVATKLAFEGEVKDLKIANKKLYEEIKELKLKSSVEHIVYIEGETKFLPGDTVYVVQNINNGFERNFNFNDDWRDLEGEIKYNNDSLKLDITKHNVRFDYTLALDDKNRIHVKSSNPYLQYNEISGYTVPKRKKTHFSIGPSVGVGYGVFNNKVDLFVGVNATWKLFNF